MALTDLPSVSCACSFEEQDERLRLGAKFFAAAVLCGTALRLFAAIFGDVGVYADGASRIELAIGWADKPSWQGLSGVWPPLHWYFLGVLIDTWNHPIVLAKAITLALSVATIFVFRNAVRHSFANVIGGVAALLLAVSWSHIWLTSSYWVEIPYLFFVILGVGQTQKALSSRSASRGQLAGLCFALAILLRHEGFIVMPVVVLWYALRTRDWRRTLLLAWIPVLIAACCVIEPLFKGHSFFEYFDAVAQMKVAENLVQGLSVKDCLRQWCLMLGTSPTAFVLAPGIVALYRYHVQARQDLFAWLFALHFLFYMTLTIFFGWRPQMRYLLLFSVNILPYASLWWMDAAQRFTTRYVLTALLSLTLVVQAAGWWIGRNNMLAYGWLPVQVITSSQRELDDWIAFLKRQGMSGLRIVSIAPAALDQRWSVVHSALANDVHISPAGLDEVHAYVDRELLAGVLPPQVAQADIVLVDPRMSFYPKLMEAILRLNPETTTDLIHPDIKVLLVSERARSVAGQIARHG